MRLAGKRLPTTLPGFGGGGWLFWTLGLLALALRLYLAAVTPGSTDMGRFEHFARLAEKAQFRKLYFGDVPFLWNHSAPMVFLLQAVTRLSDLTGWPFAYAFRLVPSLADFGNGLLVFVLARRGADARWATFAAAAYWLSPAAIITAGLHGNTDCLMVFFLLAGVALFASHVRLGALVLGLALCTKYPALLVIGVLLLSFVPGPRQAAWYLALALGPFLVVTAAVVRGFARRALANIGSYGSEPNAWGLGHLQQLFATGPAAVTATLAFLVAHGKLVVLGAASGLALANRWTGRLSPQSLVAGAWAVFFVFTPGFATQYVVWLLPFFIIESPLLALVFNVAASHFVVHGFLIGQRNRFDMILPAIGATPMAVLAWAACVVLMVRLARRCLRS